jgi:hypothetical protein
MTTHAYSVDRLGWSGSIETLKAHLPVQIRSRVVKTLGFLAVALVSAEIGSHASVPDASGICAHDEVSATEMMPAAAAEASGSEVPKMPRSVAPAASQHDPLGFDIVMATGSSEPLCSRVRMSRA